MQSLLNDIPSVKQERWKYSNLQRAVKGLSLSAASLGWGTNAAPADAVAPGTNQYGDTQLWDMNSRLTSDVKLIRTDETIIIAAKDGQQLNPRIVIDIPAGKTITVVEEYRGEGAHWVNAAIQITLGENARVNHYRVIAAPVKAVCTLFTHVKIAAGAHYNGFSFIDGDGFIRNQTHAEILGENAHCGLAGVNLLSGEQHADTTITIEHTAPNCTSNQTFKSVLTHKARGVFQGKVHVHQAAQKTDGYQLSNALILSPQAEMDTKPELEIYADDVKCSHGATTGKLDDAPLFYLRARGIPENTARALLIEAFCAQALECIDDEAFFEQIGKGINTWLMSRL